MGEQTEDILAGAEAREFGTPPPDPPTVSEYTIDDLLSEGAGIVTEQNLIEHLVRDFHVHFGLPIGDTNKTTNKTTNKLRADLVAQEARELVEALQVYDEDPSPENLAKVAHEGADVLFAVVGTNLTLGIDTDQAAIAVYHSLMTRQGANEHGKVVKGPYYVPPDMSAALPRPAEPLCDCRPQRHQRGGPGCVDYFSMGG